MLGIRENERQQSTEMAQFIVPYKRKVEARGVVCLLVLTTNFIGRISVREVNL